MLQGTGVVNGLKANGKYSKHPVVKRADTILNGKEIREKEIEQAAEAAAVAAEPQDDMRGTADYKRQLVRALTREALQAALRRARGERKELSHHYA